MVYTALVKRLDSQIEEEVTIEIEVLNLQDLLLFALIKLN